MRNENMSSIAFHHGVKREPMPVSWFREHDIDLLLLKIKWDKIKRSTEDMLFDFEGDGKIIEKENTAIWYASLPFVKGKNERNARGETATFFLCFFTLSLLVLVPCNLPLFFVVDILHNL